MNELYKTLSEQGFVTGYHNHDSDFTNYYEEKTFYEYTMDNTPEDFLMVLDTGNAVAGGSKPIELIKKYPERMQIMHIKGYSERDKYVTPVWEADFDWHDIISLAIKIGGTEYFDIEFGARDSYDPIQRAEISAKWLIETINEEVAKCV